MKKIPHTIKTRADAGMGALTKVNYHGMFSEQGRKSLKDAIVHFSLLADRLRDLEKKGVWAS